MSQRFPARSARKPSRRLRRHSRRFKAPAFILSTAAALMLPQMVKAQIYWDPDGNSANPTLGGSGIWNTTSLSWDTNFDGTNQAWVNNAPNGDFARFEGAGGTIQLGVPITARLLDFAVPGYELTNGGNPANTLTLAGLGAGFLLQSGRIEVGVQILSLPYGNPENPFDPFAVGDGLRVDNTTPNLDGLTGTLALTNSNNLYSGTTTISAGVLEINNLPNVGQPSSIGVGGPEFAFDGFSFGRNFNPYLSLDGGTLRYVGDGTSTNRTMTVTNRGGGIDSSGTGGALGFSVPVGGVQVIGVGARTFTLSGTNTAYNNIAAQLSDADFGSPLSVVKTGPGTWVTSSANIYTGSTTIDGGTLLVTTLGSTGAASGIGAADNIPQNLVFNGGTLRYTGAASANDRSFSIGVNGGRIESSGSGALQFLGTGTVATPGTGDRVMTLGGVALDNIMRVQITDPTTAWVLTGANTIARFSPATPEIIEQSVTITNLQSGENLHSIDFDPGTGKLYAMGTTNTGQVSRLYEINLPAANATTTTAASFSTVTGLNVGTASNYGFDIDSTGRVHLTTNEDKSYSFAQDGTGLVTLPNINPAGTTVVGLAFDPGMSGTLFGLDSEGDNLVRVDPATGLTTTVGSFDTSTRNYSVLDVSGIDIASNGSAFGVLQDTATTTYRFVGINLTTGDASLLGLAFNPIIGPVSPLLAVRDLAVTVSGKTSLVKTGPGSWTLDRFSKHLGNTYTGSTTINQGRLTLNFNLADTPDNDLISPRSPLIMAGGGLTIAGKNPTGTSPNIVTYDNFQTLNGLTLMPGGSTITASSGTGASTLELNLGALETRPTFATLTLQTSGNATIKMTAANNGTGILGAWASLNGTEWPMMGGTNGDEVLPLPVGSYTTVALGAAIGNGSNHVRLSGGSGNVTLGAATTTINTLNQAHTAAATINNAGQTLRLGATGGILLGNQALTIGTAANSGRLTAGGTDNTPGELILHNNSTALLTINSVITNNGTGAVSVVNAGSGITVLNGVNTYTGDTVLNGGQLFIGDNRALSTSTVVVNSSVTPVVLASSSTAGREIRNDFILNSDLQFVDNRTTGATGVGGLVIRGAINLTGGERIITVNQANGYVTLDGTITNGALVKSGPGSLAFNDLTLTNVSSITLAQGSLDIWAPAGLGDTPINVIPGSTGVLSGSGAFYTPVFSDILLGGNLTLGRAQVSDGIDLGGFIDLSNSTFLNPRIISAAGAFPQQQQRLSGTIVNGSLGKAGSSELVVTGNTSTFEGATTIFSTTTGSTLRIAANARLGANVLGNDIYVVQDPGISSPALLANSFATLRLDSLASLGDKQAIVLSNFTTGATPVLAWGSAFEADPGEVGFVEFSNGTIFNTGLKNIRVYASGFFGTPGPMSIAIDGIDSHVDVVSKVLEGQNLANANVWLGATLANGVYQGKYLATNPDLIYRLGGGGGTLTIANENVLTGQFHNVIVGSYDQTARGITGTVFLPKAQNFGGILSIGTGTTLVTGRNDALGTGSSPIYFAGGTLNLRSTGAHHSTDSQYVGRDFAFLANGVLNIDPLGGGQNGRVDIGGLDLSQLQFSTEGVAPAAPTFTMNISNNFELRVTRPVTLISNLPQTPSASVTNTFTVNSGFLSIESEIGQSEPLTPGTPAGANFQKAGGGTLILSQPMTHTGLTIANGGTFVLTDTDIVPGIMRLQSGVFSLRSNSATPAVYDFPTFQLFGATASTIFVGPISPTGVATYSGTRMDLPNIVSVANGSAFPTALTVNGTLNSSLRVLGTTSIGANFTMTVNAARAELVGNIIGASGSAFNFTKAGIGTLILSGRNNLTGNTAITQGTIVANHDTAGGIADTFSSGTLSFTGASSGAILIAGARTISKTIALDSTGGTQILGGYDTTGAKIFSGDIAISTASGNTGVTLAAETGSTVNFTGVISGASAGATMNVGSLTGGVLLPIPGTPSLGRGTIVLNPSGTTGNTFLAPIAVNNGTLIGHAQATGGTSPFGAATNAITINQGTLQLTGRTTATNTVTSGALTIAGGAQLAIDDPADAPITRFTVGSLTRTGNGTLNFLPTNQAALTITSAPTPVNGILAPWMVKTTGGLGDFVMMSGNDVVTAAYTGGTDINASAGSAAIVNDPDGGTLTADRSAFALRLGGTLDLGGNTLGVGNPLTAAQGGLILNNGAGFTNGTLNVGLGEGLVYVSGNSTIGAAIVGNGTTSLTKFGDGTLTLTPAQYGTLAGSSANTYRGATAVARGTLRLGAENALGRWTNAGLRNATALTVNANGVLDLNGFDTEVGSLAGNYGAVVNVGSKRLTVGRNNTSTVFSGALLGSGSLQKVGTGALTLDNTRADGSASTFNGSIFVDQGTLILVIADQTNGTPYAVGNALASVPTINLRGGTLSLRTSGDNVAASNQNMMGKYNIVSIGANSILDVTRFGGTETQKTIELGDLTLGVNEFQTTMSTSAAVVPAFMGTVTLTDNARINTNSAEMSISGVITDNGQGFTLNKFGGSNLFIFNSNNNYSGGTVVVQGNLFFGARGPDVMRFAGNNFVPNDSGRAGTGPILLQTNTVINFTDRENLAPGQTVRLLSGTTTHGSASGFVIQTDRSVSEFNLRTLGRGSLQIGVQSGTYSTPIDMSKIGNGEWGLSSGRSVETLYTAPTLGAGIGNTHRFYGSSGSAFVIMGQNAITGTDVVEVGRSLLDLGTNPGQSNSSIRYMLSQDYTGKTLIHRNANAAGPANALLDFRGTLASGTSASNPIEVYGRLVAIGAGTFTNSETAQNNVNTHVLLRPGSELALDYNNNASNATTFLVPLGTTSATGFLNKWGDSEPIILDGATLRVQSAAGSLTTEVIGAVTYKGAAEIFPQSAGTGGNSVVILNGAMTRVNLGTMAFRTTLGQFGASGEPGTTAGQRVVFKAFNGNPLHYVNLTEGMQRGVVSGGTANGTVIRMVSPRFFSNTANTFVDYDPNTVLGFSDVPLTTVNSSTLNSGGLNDGTAILDHITTAVTVANNTDIWALRTGVSIGANTDYNDVITIRSGGLAITAGLDIFPKLSFKNGTTVQEADIWTVAAGSSVTLRGKITANNLVKTGPETLVLSADNSVSGGEGLTGSLQVNGGTLVLGGVNTNPSAADTLITAAQALGGVTNLRLHAGNFNNASNQMPQVTLLSNVVATYNQSITVSQFVPYATINVDRVGTSGTNVGLTVAGGLTIEGGGSDGTVLVFTNGNDFDFTSSGPTILGVPMNGDPGTTPIGINVTNSNGTNNVMLLGRVSGAAPLVKSGNGPLILANNGTGVTGNAIPGITINDGTLQLRNGDNGSGAATGFQAAGTGSILLNRGTLELFGATNNANHANLDANNLTIAGHAILAFNRPAASATTLFFGGTNSTLTTQNSTNITVNSGTTVSGVWAGRTVVNDSPTFNVAQTSLTLGNASVGDSVSGTGHIYKTGANVLIFNSNAANNFSGGLDIFQGQVAANTTNDTLGSGPIRVSPTGLIGVAGPANISAAQIAGFASNSTALAGLVIRANQGVISPAQIAAMLPAGTGDGNGGLLALNVSYSGNLDLSIFDQNWFLGATTASSYTGATLVPGAGATYRVGGGGATLTLGSATPANILGGANKVLVGKPHGIAGNGTVVFAGNNTYTGGTTISRVRDSAGNPTTVSQIDVQRGFSDTPLGSGAVDVFGNLQFISSGTAGLQGSAVSNAGLGDTNRNTYTFHPGSRLIFQNSTVYADTVGNAEGRWANNASIALRSSSVEMLGNTTAGTNGNNTFNSETIGAVTFEGGSEMRVARGGTGVDAQLIMPSLQRVGSGTLTLVHVGGALGVRPYNNGAPQGTGVLGTGVDAISITDRSNLVDTNGVVKPFVLSRTDNNFLFYDAANDSLRPLTQALADANGILYSTNAAATVSLNEPLAILDNNAAATLNGIMDIYALRLQQDLSPSANGQFNTVTIRSGGLTLGSAARTINTNLNFGTAASPAEALIHASSANLTINGVMSASAITKFGVSSITINQDQPLLGPSVPWNLNQGQIIVQTPGGLGNGPIFLNGTAGNSSGQTITELRFNFNPGTPEELRFTSGKITALDWNLIRAQTAADRTVRIADLDLKTTNAVPGTGIPGIVWLRVDGARSQMRTGTITMFDDYVMHVEATNNGPGTTISVRPDAINNRGNGSQGPFNLTKTGDAVLVLGDNSSTFNGGTITVNEGAVKVLSNGSLGTGTTTIIDNGGALEIATPNFTPLGTLVQRPGSIERWSVNNARSTAEVDIGSNGNRGVHLQVAMSQTGTKTLNLWGGSIMGYLAFDLDEAAVFHSLGSGISVKLKADSMLGQPYPAGTNVVGGGANHIYYDMGKQNQMNNPLNPQLNGSMLDIRGNISGETGNEKLTKVGMDAMQISGSNSGFNTTVREGLLVLGSSNALPSNKALEVTNSGTLDLNGFNATTGTLSGVSSNAVIGNSATTMNTLTVNGGSGYAGGLTGHLEFKFAGGPSDNFTLSGNHSHSGATTVASGTLVLTGSASGTLSYKAGGGATLNVANANGSPNSFQLLPGQTLAGGNGASIGTVQGTVAVKNESFLSPGMELGQTGILQFADNLDLESGARFKLDLAGNLTGQYDQIIVNGSMLNLGGATLEGDVQFGSVQIGQVYYIAIHNGGGSTTGAFAGLPQASFFMMDGYEFQISYTADFGGAGFANGTNVGNDVALLVTIPEPGSLAGLCAGLGTLLGLRRFRRRAAN